MRWKTTLILLATVIALGAYVSYDLRQPSVEEHARLANEIVSLEPESVTQLAINGPTTNITLTKAGTGWVIAPSNQRANPSVIDRLTHLLSLFEADRVLAGTPEHPLDLKSMGLEPAPASLTVVAHEKPLTIHVGQATPLQSKRYVKVSNRPEVFVVSGELFDAITQPREAFRDHALARVNDDADAVTITGSSGTVRAARDAQHAWRLEQPLADAADPRAVDTLLSHISEVTITRFIEDAPTPEQRAGWGLDKPFATIQLGRTTLTIGNALTGAQNVPWRYAARSDEPSVYAVDGADVARILPEADELREKRCFVFFEQAATAVEFAAQGTTWKIVKSQHQWQDAAGTVVAPGKLSGIFRSLANLLAVSFIENAPVDLGRYGLNPPYGSVAVTSSDRAQRVLVGNKLSGSNDRYGQIEGRLAVIRLPAAINELLMSPRPAPAPTAPAPGSGAEPARPAAVR